MIRIIIYFTIVCFSGICNAEKLTAKELLRRANERADKLRALEKSRVESEHRIQMKAHERRLHSNNISAKNKPKSGSIKSDFIDEETIRYNLQREYALRMRESELQREYNVWKSSYGDTLKQALKSGNKSELMRIYSFEVETANRIREEAIRNGESWPLYPEY